MKQKRRRERERERGSMGCATSVYDSVGKKKRIVQESVVFVLQLRVPVQSDLQRQLKGVAPKTTVERLACLRNQIQLVAEDTGNEEFTTYLSPFLVTQETDIQSLG